MRVLNQKSLVVSLAPDFEVVIEFEVLEDAEGSRVVIWKEEMKRGGIKLGGIAQTTVFLENRS